MKKTMTILAALALGAGMPVTLAADPIYDALRPAEGGIEYVAQGVTVTYEGKEGILTVEQDAAASTSNRTALVKDGLGTLYIRPESADNQDISFNHSLVVREGTMVMQGVTMTNETGLESPNLTVGGNQAHLVLDGATYTKPTGPVSAIVVGGRDGDGTLTLRNQSEMWNCQAILAGYPSFEVLSDSSATNAHVSGTYKTRDKNDGLYRDRSFFSADYTYSGGDPDVIYMSKAVINVLDGSTLAAGTFIQTQNAEFNIEGEGSLLRDAHYAVSAAMDNNLGESYGSDSGKYQPKTVVNIRNGGKFWLQDLVTLSYFNGGSTEILVSGEGSVLQWDSYAYNCSATTAVHRSESLMTVEKGGTAIVSQMYMGRLGAGERTTVLRVADSLSTYNGDVLEIYADALFENCGTTNIAQSFYVDATGAFVNAEGARLSLGTADPAQPHIVAAGAYLVNDGQMSTESVCSVSGTLAGSGRMGSVQLLSGSTLYAGGSVLYDDERTVVAGIQPSAGSPHFDALTLGSGTSLVFYVDGDAAATQENDGSGTYSNIVVDNGGLTADAGISAELVLGSGVYKRAMARADKAIPLQLVTEQADAADAEATDRTLELNMTYQVSGEHAGLFSVDENGILRLVLSPDAVAAGTVHGASDLLNTLWASTGMVQDFARKAVMTQAPSRSSSPQEDLRDYFGRGKGVSLWGSGLGYFSNMGGAHGFDFNSGGYAVGCDAELMRDWDWNVRAGLAFGQGFGTFKSDAGSTADQDALMFALYGGADRRLRDDLWLYVGGYAAYGRVDNEARTRFIDGSPGVADWDDDVWSCGLQAELHYRVSEYFMVTPFTGLDYVYGSHGSLTEDFGDGLQRRYGRGAMQVWRVPVGVRFSTAMALWDKAVVIPELSLAYVGDISRSNPHATVEVAGSKARVYGSNPGRSALMLQAGATFILDERWSTGAAYHLEVRSGQTAQGVNAYLRYQF